MRTRTITTPTATPNPIAVRLRGSQARQQSLQAMLHEREREMRTTLQGRLLHPPHEAQDDGLDDTEHAEAEIQEHIAVAVLQMKGDALQRLREALDRLEAGEYGFCDDCGLEIAEKRLQALPFALRCTACEASHEQQEARQRRFGSRVSSPVLFGE